MEQRPQMNRWLKLTALALLEDKKSRSFLTKDLHPWQDLFLSGRALIEQNKQEKVLKEQQKKEALKKIAQSPSKLVAGVSQAKIFSSKPSLRQMMKDYNGRQSTLPPIKKNKPSKKASRPGFQFDSVELIELPSISGKILRPQT